MKAAGVFLLIFFLAGCTQQTTNELRVGAILPLTGDWAFIGQEMQKGIELRADEAIAANIPLHIIYEDDQNNEPKLATTAATKLIDVDKANVLIVMAVQESRVLGPMIDANKVPLVVGWDNNEFVTGAGEYVFGTGFSTELTGDKLAEFAYNNLSTRKAAIISHEDVWGELISKRFKQRFEALGGEVVFIETIPPDNADFRSQLLKIKQTKPDVLFYPMLPSNFALLIKQTRQANLNMPIVAGDTFIVDVGQEAGEAAEGIYSATIYAEKDLTEAYTAKYGIAPIDANIVYLGYDAMDKIVRAYQSGKSIHAGLVDILGPTRGAQRVEKMYQWRNGTLIAIE
jgi:branched-chain amino acid transport system substrate-binding protein